MSTADPPLPQTYKSPAPMLEQTKIEIRENQARASARTLFNETYDALVQTLRDTYPICKEISSRSPTGDMALEWYTCMEQHQKRVIAQDKTLMLANVSVLMSLRIPQLCPPI
jgi:hypothetical protein